MLTVQKLRYSRAPWRICQVIDGRCVAELRFDGLWWSRKRDAHPVLEQLRQAGYDWELPIRQWPPHQKATLRDQIEQLSCVQEEQAVVEAIHAWQMRGVRQ